MLRPDASRCLPVHRRTRKSSASAVIVSRGCHVVVYRRRRRLEGQAPLRRKVFDFSGWFRSQAPAPRRLPPFPKRRTAAWWLDPGAFASLPRLRFARPRSRPSQVAAGGPRIRHPPSMLFVSYSIIRLGIGVPPGAIVSVDYVVLRAKGGAVDGSPHCFRAFCRGPCALGAPRAHVRHARTEMPEPAKPLALAPIGSGSGSRSPGSCARQPPPHAHVAFPDVSTPDVAIPSSACDCRLPNRNEYSHAAPALCAKLAVLHARASCANLPNTALPLTHVLIRGSPIPIGRLGHGTRHSTANGLCRPWSEFCPRHSLHQQTRGPSQ